jgi:hypothetical protein
MVKKYYLIGQWLMDMIYKETNPAGILGIFLYVLVLDLVRSGSRRATALVGAPQPTGYAMGEL